MFFCFFRHTVFTHTRYIHWLTAFDWLILLQQSASGLGSLSIRIYSGIARFPCDSMAFLFNNESNFAQLFRQHFTRFSNECQLPSRYLNWGSKCPPAAATQNRSLFRNRRVALLVNSCGKSFHIEARQSSARQCWLDLAYSVLVLRPHRTTRASNKGVMYCQRHCYSPLNVLFNIIFLAFICRRFLR